MELHWPHSRSTALRGMAQALLSDSVWHTRTSCGFSLEQVQEEQKGKSDASKEQFYIKPSLCPQLSSAVLHIARFLELGGISQFGISLFVEVSPWGLFERFFYCSCKLLLQTGKKIWNVEKYWLGREGALPRSGRFQSSRNVVLVPAQPCTSFSYCCHDSGFGASTACGSWSTGRQSTHCPGEGKDIVKTGQEHLQLLRWSNLNKSVAVFGIPANPLWQAVICLSPRTLL